MEPVSIAMGAVAMVAFSKRCEQKALRALRAPPSLPDVLNHDATQEMDEQVLAVHIGSTSLCRQCAKDRFQIRVKYGAQGESVACETDTVQAEFEHSKLSSFVAQLEKEPLASATYNTTCLFSAVPDEMILRIRLVKTGFRTHTVATAELRLPRPSQFSQQNEAMDVCLEDKFDKKIGHLSLSIGFASVDRTCLRKQLKRLGAIEQAGAFAIHQVSEGKVLDDCPIIASNQI